MCYNCGCHNPQDDMGSPDNITVKTLHDLSHKLSVSEETLRESLFQYLSSSKTDNPEFETMYAKAAKAWGQSVEEAKKETQKMLKEELHH